VINQPQVAILGVGAVEKRPIVIATPRQRCDRDQDHGLLRDHLRPPSRRRRRRRRFMLELKRTLEEDKLDRARRLQSIDVSALPVVIEKPGATGLFPFGTDTSCPAIRW